MAEIRPAVVGQSSERAQAFLGLAEDHLDSAYRLARAILRDSNDAQDATHDAFEQAWRKWSTLRDPARFGQWFDRILVNTCRDRLRSARRRRGHLGRGCDDIRTSTPRRMTATCSPARSRRSPPSTASSSPFATTATSQSRRSPRGWAFRSTPSIPVCTTPSSVSTRRSTPPTARNHTMTDHELEQHLRSWYRAEIPIDEAAPPALRSSIASIPRVTRTPLGRIRTRRGLRLLAVAAILTAASIGGALLTGSTSEQPPSVVKPSARPALGPSVASPDSRPVALDAVRQP